MQEEAGVLCTKYEGELCLCWGGCVCVPQVDAREHGQIVRSGGGHRKAVKALGGSLEAVGGPAEAT